MAQLDFNQLHSQQISVPSIMHVADDEQGYALIEISGDDAITFLQGQVSADIAALAINQGTTAALCNPKGRVIAVLEVIRFEHNLVLITQSSMREAITQHLHKYVMRSKVVFSSPEDEPKLLASTVNNRSIEPGQAHASKNLVEFEPTWMGQQPHPWVFTNDPAVSDESTAISWRQAHLLWGYAGVNHNTTEQHLPQAIGLDELDAISYTKGCYTGQEIIARIHHRGKVARRLQRYLLNASLTLNYGEALVGKSADTDSNTTTAGDVVEYAHDDFGNTAVLAVIKQSMKDQTLFLQDTELLSWPLSNQPG